MNNEANAYPTVHSRVRFKVVAVVTYVFPINYSLSQKLLHGSSITQKAYLYVYQETLLPLNEFEMLKN